MKKLLESYSSIIPIMLFIIYTLGYIQLRIFYQQFGISIEHYMTLTDMLFYAIKLIIVIFFVLVFIFFTTILFSVFVGSTYLNWKYRRVFKERGKTKEVNSRFIGIRLVKYAFIFQSIYCTLLLAIVYFKTGEIFYPFTLYLIMIFTIMYASLPFISKSKKNIKRGKLRDRDYVFVVLIIVFMTISFYQGVRNANEIKSNSYYFSKPKNCEFLYEENKFSTMGNSEFRFVGETTDYIFLYSSCNIDTQIFKKEDIKNFKIINPEKVSLNNVRYNFQFTDIFIKLINSEGN